MCGVGAILRDGCRVDFLAEIIEAANIVDRVFAVGGDPELLAVLVLVVRVRRNCLNRQFRKIAITGGIPIPGAPCADGGECRRPEIPIGDGRNAAKNLVGLRRRVGVDIPVEGIKADRRVSRRGCQRGELLSGGFQRRPDADETQGAAYRTLRVVIAG